MNGAIDLINLRTMRSPHVVAHYSRPAELMAHERAALDHVAADYGGEPILDIGVGGGRTVSALRSISTNYLGIDYSPEMVRACRQRFPGVQFADADARQMSAVADESISLAVFSCNGISMVGHDDRMRIIHEVHRVLRPGGAFVFTTYNRNSPEAEAGFRLPELQLSRNPLRLLVRAVRWARDLGVSFLQRRRHLRHEVRTSRYALLNDICHNYGVMLYYIGLERQREQLEDAGFAPNALAFDRNGLQIHEGTSLDSFAFVALKP